MKKFLFLVLIISFGFCDEPITASEALNQLMEGNARFAKDKPIQLNRSIKARKALKSGQNPIAVIVACSDSRVAPEILFDANLGDLFVIRLAGNVVSQIALESIAYAVSELQTPLIFVIGHQNCGAVDAVIQGKAAGVPEIAKQIEPSVKKARQMKPSDLLLEAIKLNAIHTKKEIRKNLYHNQKDLMNLTWLWQSQRDTSEEHHSQIEKDDEECSFGKFAVNKNSQKLRGSDINPKAMLQAGYYDFKTGKVELLN